MAARPRTSAEREADVLTHGDKVSIVLNCAVFDGEIVAAVPYEFPDRPSINFTTYSVRTRYFTHDSRHRGDIYRREGIERAELLDRLRADMDSLQGEINALIDAESGVTE